MKEKARWELTIVDGAPEEVADEEGLGSLVVADIDGDGKPEIITGGAGALLWYRPATADKGVIDRGTYHVGLAVGDVDGDGKVEVLAGTGANDPAGLKVVYYAQPQSRGGQWQKHVVDDCCTGGAHDVLICDLDGDGEVEILATACYFKPWGIFIYKRRPEGSWAKHTLQEGSSCEGLAVVDLDGDGRLEVVSGPYVFSQPEGGPFAGEWSRMTYAPSHREMCRMDVIDINGDGRPDIVCVDSEYLEGQLSWFENRPGEDGPEWIEHGIERPLVFAHSLFCRREGKTAKIFTAEMAGGGWKAPYNFDARLIEYTTVDGGATWSREILDSGQGSHQATMFDIDGDGELEVVGKEWRIPRVQIWKRPGRVSAIARYRHRFIDRDKPCLSTDILASDVDGDGRQDVVCGRFWYRNGDWRRFEIPGICQVMAAYDIDEDGRIELIATRPAAGADVNGYDALSSDIVWLKAVDALAGRWQMHEIGRGVGDWVHGSCVAPLLPGGRLALVTSYHSAHSSKDGGRHFPEIWEAPEDLSAGTWARRPLAEIVYGEEIVPGDIAGNGRLDLFAGPWWLENLGDGTFMPHRLVSDETFYPARLAVADIAGTGGPDVVMGQEAMDYPGRHVPFSRLAWFERPRDPHSGPWKMHVIDRIRCAHSISAADLDGDGCAEIVCGEHDPFYPYRKRNRLFVYKRACETGRYWKRFQLDDRFEHHDGTKVIELAPGRVGIISHAWQEPGYVHLWEGGDELP